MIVNDYHVLADGCPGFLKLVTEAKQNGVPFDGIGIQAHEPRTMRFPLDRVQEILDQYASLGKELHITEFTPTSSGQKIIRLASRGRLGRSGPGRLRREVLPSLLRPSGDAGHHLVGPVRPGLVAARRRHAAGRHVTQTRVRATEATDPRGVEDPSHPQRPTPTVVSRFGDSVGEYRMVIETPGGKVERQFQLRKGGPTEIVVRLAASKDR